MALLTRQQITGAGVTPSFGAAAGGGDTFAPGEHTFVEFKNTNAATRTVTINDQNSVKPAFANLFDPDYVVVIPATTGDKMIGPCGARFADLTDGLVHMTYDAVTNLTVGVFFT